MSRYGDLLSIGNNVSACVPKMNNPLAPASRREVSCCGRRNGSRDAVDVNKGGMRSNAPVITTVLFIGEGSAAQNIAPACAKKL
jgi:hypothetical protein